MNNKTKKPKDILSLMLRHQKKLMKETMDMDKWSLQNLKITLEQLAWKIIKSLTRGTRSFWGKSMFRDSDFFMQEIIRALHLMVTFILISNLRRSDFEKSLEDAVYHYQKNKNWQETEFNYTIVYILWCFSQNLIATVDFFKENQLKMVSYSKNNFTWNKKEWVHYKEYVVRTFVTFLDVINLINIGPDEVYQYFLQQKVTINKR